MQKIMTATSDIHSNNLCCLADGCTTLRPQDTESNNRSGRDGYVDGQMSNCQPMNCHVTPLVKRCTCKAWRQAWPALSSALSLYPASSPRYDEEHAKITDDTQRNHI